MSCFDRHQHWEKIYQSKSLDEVSWYQPSPATSLDFLKQLNVPLDAKIIDIGGGDSLLVDHLLKLGYTNISVLDISESALDKAKNRLGEQAKKVEWIVADIAAFEPSQQYDVWHDRATFHFLTQEEEIGSYIHSAKQAICESGVLVIGTFSDQGPEKCSGIKIKQYTEQSLPVLLKRFFKKIKCIRVNHQTPFNTIQNFVFCSFRKVQIA